MNLSASGSTGSNGGHRPLGPKSTIAGAPVRVDTATATAADVGKARMLLTDGSIDVRYFLLNASMGLVAEGNHYFNTAGGVVARLKPVNVELRHDTVSPLELDGEITNVASARSSHTPPLRLWPKSHKSLKNQRNTPIKQLSNVTLREPGGHHAEPHKVPSPAHRPGKRLCSARQCVQLCHERQSTN